MKLFCVRELKPFAELLCQLMTRGGVIQQGLAVTIEKEHRIVASAVDGRVSLKSPGGVSVAKDNLGLIRQVNPELDYAACPQLHDLVCGGSVSLGPVSVRSTGDLPQLVCDDAGDHARIRCLNTVLELDYPGPINPDIDEVCVYPDQIVIKKSGIDVSIVFE